MGISNDEIDRRVAEILVRGSAQLGEIQNELVATAWAKGLEAPPENAARNALRRFKRRGHAYVGADYPRWEMRPAAVTAFHVYRDWPREP